MGKTLGVIGLGAIGRLVANVACSLGMTVVGCDPYLSEAAAKMLSPDVKVVSSYDEIYSEADYITLHVPATPQTKGMINATTLSSMKDGVKLLNFSRADLVIESDMVKALENGKVAKYVVDFPTVGIIGASDKIIAIPHLGASTEESEDNCAVMAANQTIDYLENGNIVNSVNYPNFKMPRATDKRVCVLAKNADVAEITKAVAGIAASGSASKGDYVYAVYDVTGDVDTGKISAVDGVIRVIVL